MHKHLPSELDRLLPPADKRITASKRWQKPPPLRKEGQSVGSRLMSNETLSKMKRANFEKISPIYSRTGCKNVFSQECKIHIERCVRMPITCERELMITWPWRVPFRSLLGPLRRPLPGDGLEASLDGLHGASEVK